MPRQQTMPRGKGSLKANKHIMGRLARYIFKLYGVHLVIVLICILASVLCSLQGTMFMQNLIDDYITPMLETHSTDFGPLLGAIGRVAGFYALGVVCAFLYNFIMAQVTQGTLRALRDEMFVHMEELPIRYFDTHQHGDIMSIYTNDIDALRQMISQSIPQMINSGVTVIGVIVCMIKLSIPLTIVTMGMVAIMLLTTKFLAGNSGKYFAKQQRNLGRVNGNIEEMMNGQKVIKVFCHEEQAMEEFNALNDELFDSAYQANKYSNMLGPANAQIGNVSYVVVAVVGGILAIGGFGGFTLGGLASFLTFNKSCLLYTSPSPRD